MNRMAGRRILVLEDEPIIAMALEDAIEDAGAHALYASNLNQAQAMIAMESIDAAVLDVNIHGEQSYDVAAQLAEREIPFVFASGYGDTVHPPQFCNITTVSKPYQIATIADALLLAL